MKSILFLIIFLTFFGSIYSQSLSENELLGKFAGTWQWSIQKDTFRIKLIKDTLRFKGHDTTFNMIFGWHQFIEQGKILETNIEFAECKKNKRASIVGMPKENNVLSLTFKDYTRDRHFTIEMKFTNQDFNEISWTSSFNERIRINEPPPKIRTGQTVPSPILLKKLQW